MLASLAQIDAHKATSLMHDMVAAGQQAQVGAALAGMDRPVAGSLLYGFTDHRYEELFVGVLTALQAVDSHATEEMLASMAQTDARKATWLIYRMADAWQRAQVAAALARMDRAVAGSLLAHFVSREFGGVRLGSCSRHCRPSIPTPRRRCWRRWRRRMPRRPHHSFAP
jgi:hypothetical protein